MNFGRDALWYGLAVLIPRALGFALLPIYTHYLDPSIYGHVSLAETIAALVAVVATVGGPAGVRRLFFEHEGHPDEKSWLVTIFTFGATTCLTVIALTSVTFGVFESLGIFTGLPVLAYLVPAVVTACGLQLFQMKQAEFQARGLSRTYAMSGIAVGVASTGLGAAGVLLGLSGWGLLTGRALPVACVVVAFAAYVLSKRELWNFGEGYLKEFLTFSAPLVPHSMVAFILGAGDRILIEMILGSAPLGTYSLGYTVGAAIGIATSATMLLWTPRYFRWAKDNLKQRLAQGSFGLICLLSGIAILASSVADPFIRFVMNARYHDAGTITGIVMLGYAFHGLFSLWHLGMMQAKKTSRVVFVTAGAGALNILLNLWWIPSLGIEGAAWATVAAFGLEAALMAWYSHSVYPLEGYKIGQALIVAALLLACLNLYLRALDSVPSELTLGFGVLLGLSVAVCGYRPLRHTL